MVMIGALTACGGGSSDSDESGVLRVAVGADVSSLDPIRGSAGSDHVMLYPVYDTLVSFDEGLKAEPGLATSWEQISPEELKLELREGVTFHDGTVFDAEAVKYNLDRARAEGSNVASDLASVKDVRVEDDRTVVIELAQSDASILMVLADRAGMMVSPTAAKAADGDLSMEPVGTGGWEFGEWKRGASVRFEEYADYWDDKAQRADTLQFNVITEPKTRLTSLQSGQQDVAIELAPSDAKTLESSQDVELEQSPRLWFNHVYLNRTSPELKDPRVRRALNVAIDRESILETGYFGRGATAHSPMPADYWASPSESATYPYDQDEARSLLKAAGASNLSFDMLTNADAATVRVGEILKAAWAEVGVTVTLKPREVVQATTDYVEDKRAPALLSAFTGRPDPAMTFRLMFREDGYFNASGETTPGLDAALADANASIEEADRAPGMQAAAQAVYEDSSYLPLNFADSLVGVRKDVKGFQNNLLGKPKFIGVERG